jgi:hypothetical protein
MSLSGPSNSGYCRWPLEGVGQCLPALAPQLAPRNLLVFANARMSECIVDDARFAELRATSARW